jgi:uncharacterized protein YsxB (DUF464 family)
MIEIVYHRKYNSLTIKGHALSAEKGKDLVCASASMLAYTLAANVERLTTGGQAKKPVIRLDEGDAEISCVPQRRFNSVVTLIFDSICAGFTLLSSEYPDNVSFKILG